MNFVEEIHRRIFVDEPVRLRHAFGLSNALKTSDRWWIELHVLMKGAESKHRKSD